MLPFPPDARFVLTGPSGWIGSATLAALASRAGGPLGGRVIAFASAGRSMELPSGERLAVRDLRSIGPEDVDGAHVIHLAYLTREKVEEIGERQFTDTNLAIDDALLAALSGARPASLFVASSGAAALAARGVDLHPYGLVKLRQEARFLEWSRKSGVPAIAGRIFNIAGPHINKHEAYAISNFILQAQRQREIAVQARIPVFRSFLHVNDLSNLIIEAGLRGVGRQRPIDLCGGEVLEMGDVAALVAAALGNVPVRREPVDHGSSSAYLGDFTDTRILAMELGIDLLPLSLQVESTIEWLADSGTKAACHATGE
ncbi:NAD(P)-dependent oxidoreductase [Tsuneonella sp. CC-YZS046]|uniref:NAD-dependent epimerase/dehydratase family protein n=1 Tax=Tsuneonella sp. CC-YZS046 TaxID=3042152 RepID=UPI002D77D06D|nr:NAD(P)-dependent oxidoreductase [Tsuneonella sp. CC-YZS046]WRO65586.1 NAD(P)-dependent oxidoreductase [Tsuneonella sp. CC-YZS046]